MDYINPDMLIVMFISNLLEIFLRLITCIISAKIDAALILNICRL